MNYFDEDEIEEIAEGEVKVNPKGITATVNMPGSALESIAASIASRLENSTSRRIEKSVMEKVEQLVDDGVRKVIGDRAETLVREILDKPRQKTNEWGTPTGPTVTFAELIPGIVDSYLNTKVNDKGQVDSYHSDNKKTRAAWIIATMVREHIEPVTTNAVATVTKQARDVVAQKIAAFVSEQMVPAIEMKKGA
ncbi:hypothetical protein AB6806_27260 [Bosea sp. RCC_152_1]|uniref:hypothetical protein n=1 Tax=Bosea sp. RCC_152_1 TaxID=3239228 RepID=UPI003523C5E5